MDEAERAKREAAQERRAKVREKWRAAVERGTRVVLDCGYEELMTPRERKSMAQQVAFCYGTVKRMRKNPFQCVNRVNRAAPTHCMGQQHTLTPACCAACA